MSLFMKVKKVINIKLPFGYDYNKRKKRDDIKGGIENVIGYIVKRRRRRRVSIILNIKPIMACSGLPFV